jgi:ubiquinone/menaquinone biosynthesis C-methylase UbiE
MKATRDPEGAEIRHLVAACSLSGRRVLEIGCGSGQHTWQYATLPAQIVGIDPDLGTLQEAENLRPDPISNVALLKAIGEKLPLRSCYFDIVFFSFSF